MTEVTKKKATLQEKLERAQALVAKYENLIANGGVEGGVAFAAGDVVAFTFGRGEKKRDMQGTVLAVVDGNARIQSGEGLDVAIYKVLAVHVTANLSAPAADSDADPLASA